MIRGHVVGGDGPVAAGDGPGAGAPRPFPRATAVVVESANGMFGEADGLSNNGYTAAEEYHKNVEMQNLKEQQVEDYKRNSAGNLVPLRLPLLSYCNSFRGWFAALHATSWEPRQATSQTNDSFKPGARGIKASYAIPIPIVVSEY